MVTPTNARQLGSTNRIWLGAFVFIVAISAATLSFSPKAAAEGLLPELATIDLPLDNTPLEPVLTPVTDLTNSLLPVDINPGSNSVGTTVAPDVALPIIGKQDEPIASVNIPVQPIVRRVTQPLAAARQQAATTQRQSTVQPSPQPTPLPTVAPQAASAKIVLASAAPLPSTQQLRVIGALPTNAAQPGSNALLAAFPNSWRTAVRTITSRADFTPSIISLAILMTVIAMIVNILYISRKNGFVWDGNSRLAKLSHRIDLAQLSVLSVAMTGVIAVVIVMLASS